MTWLPIAQRTYDLHAPVRLRTNHPNTLPKWTETGIHNLAGARRAVDEGYAITTIRRTKRDDGKTTYVTEELLYKVVG